MSNLISKKNNYPLQLMLILFSVAFTLLESRAQIFDKPLGAHGLDKTSIHSAASRAMGETSTGHKNQAGLMFANPAALQSIEGIQFLIGNTVHYSDAVQVQQYGPAKYYPNFSLVMEGLTDLIPNTRLDTSTAHTSRDSVQRPYDKIGPNWSRSKSKVLPLQAMIAVPFKLGGIKIVAGFGLTEYANLNSYYQNNNGLNPAINVQRPYPIRLVTVDSLSLPVQWYQTIRNREGSINGYGASISFSPVENVALGISGVLIKGSTDDFEQKTGRGRFVFYGSYFRLDPVNYQSSKTGTSDYNGQEFTFSGMFKTNNVTFDFAVKTPTTITREFTTSYINDTAGVKMVMPLNGKDNIQIPWRGMIGVSLSIWSNLRVAAEYEIRPYNSAVYENTSGSTEHPWKSANLMKAGIEYSPLKWLTLRSGIRDQAEVYEPVGNPFEGDPVTSTIISGGLGLNFMGAIVNIAYGYQMLKYDDMLQDCVILNKVKSQWVSAEISYNIPWSL